jgi:itaconyl-CoA hydratase
VYICAWHAAALQPEALTSSRMTLAAARPSPAPPCSSGISAASQPSSAPDGQGEPGRFLEGFAVGDVYRSALGRTVTETDNIWFSNLTMNTNQMHFNDEWARRSEFKKPLVNSTFTLALVLGLSTRDTSENAAANLGWTDISLPNPVYAGDTLWAETMVTAVRDSESRPSCGIVSVRTRGINQHSEVVIEFGRAFMVYKQDAPEIADAFPVSDAPWAKGAA